MANHDLKECGLYIIQTEREIENIVKQQHTVTCWCSCGQRYWHIHAFQIMHHNINEKLKATCILRNLEVAVMETATSRFLKIHVSHGLKLPDIIIHHGGV